jgi:hypothetical protein
LIRLEANFLCIAYMVASLERGKSENLNSGDRTKLLCHARHLNTREIWLISFR